MLGYIIGAIVVMVLVVGYAYSYKLNEETEKPADCVDLECSGCKVSNCSHKK